MAWSNIPMRQVGGNINAGLGVEESYVGGDTGSAQHGDEQSGFVFTITVFFREGFCRIAGDDGGLAELDAGVADFAIKIVDDGCFFFRGGRFAGDERIDDGLDFGRTGALVDDLAVLDGDLLP